MGEYQKRRATDKEEFFENTAEQQAEIERLIAEEPDQKSRLTLLVLSRMNNALIENNRTTRNVVFEVEKIAEKLETIAKEQNEYTNKRKGAWLVFSRVIPILQLIVVGAVGLVVNDLRNLHAVDLAIIAEQARRGTIIADFREFKSRVETYMENNK